MKICNAIRKQKRKIFGSDIFLFLKKMNDKEMSRLYNHKVFTI